MIEWYGPHLDGIDLSKVSGAVARNWINEGPLTKELEQRSAEFIETKYAVAVTSGTAALALTLMAIGIERDDEVIVPDLTFAATANAVVFAGGKPVLVDIEPDRFSINADRVESAITKRTKAIISVDVNGRGSDYKRLEAICAKHDLYLVCDSAEAFGSIYSGHRLGSYGLAGCFSFSANKTISSGQGGLITTNNDKLHASLRALKDQGRKAGGTGGDDTHDTLGFNFKYTDLQAAILLPQFDVIKYRLDKSQDRDALYRDYLSDVPGIEFPFDGSDGEVRQWTDVLFDELEQRDLTVEALTKNKMGCRKFWHPLHTQKPFKSDDIAFPMSMSVSQRGLWLPSRLDMTAHDIERVYKVIKEAAHG